MARDYYTGVSEYDNHDPCTAITPTLPKPIILECGTCNDFSFAAKSSFLFMTNSHEVCQPTTLGTVAIDTTCLCRPHIKIDFSCNVHFVELDSSGVVHIEFQLFKLYDFRKEHPLGSWYFKILGEGNVSAQTFSFIYCDSNTFPECYQYSIRCQVLDIDAANISVTNCHLAALAQSGY